MPADAAGELSGDADGARCIRTVLKRPGVVMAERCGLRRRFPEVSRAAPQPGYFFPSQQLQPQQAANQLIKRPEPGARG